MRIQNWDVWLVAFANAAVGKPWKIGKTDCVTLTRRALTQMLGRDPWDGVVRHWTTLKKARQVAGQLDALDVLESTGALEVGWHFGTAGDIALGPPDEDYGLPGLSIIVPQRHALISTKDRGVELIDKLTLPEGTRFYRYE